MNEDETVVCNECSWEGDRDLLVDHEDDEGITVLACPDCNSTDLAPDVNNETDEPDETYDP